MIELASGQRKDSYAEVRKRRVHLRGMFAQRTAELGVQIIGRELRTYQAVAPIGGLCRHKGSFGLQAGYCLVAQEPYTDVHQQEMRAHQAGLCSCVGFLQHKVQPRGIFPADHEHPMVGCRHRIGPESVANYVGVGNGLQFASATQVHVATGYQCVNACGRFLHDFLVERQLQVQQILRYLLSTRPAKHGNRCQDLAAGSVSRQSAALSACMKQDAALAGQPFGKRNLRSLGGVATIEQPGGTTSRTEFSVCRVGGHIIVFGGIIRDFVERACRIGGQGKQLFHIGRFMIFS